MPHLLRHNFRAVPLLFLGACDFAQCFAHSSPVQGAAVTVNTDVRGVQVAPTTSAIVHVSVTATVPGLQTLSVEGAPPELIASIRNNRLYSGESTSVQLTATDAAIPSQRAILSIVSTLGSATSKVPITVAYMPPFTLGVSGVFADTAGGRVAGALNIERLLGFAQSVTLAITGLPASWRATVPATTGASTVPFTVDIPSSAAPGRYVGQAEASFGATIERATFVVIVSAAPVLPDFAISATPTALSIQQGQSGSSLVSIIVNQIGLGRIAFSASGMRSGVAASFVPAAATDTARVFFAVASSTPPGLDTVTITGVAGPLTRQTKIPLTITAIPVPNTLALSVSPNALTVAAGSQGVMNATIATTGTVGPVALGVTGLPPGATATVGTASSATAPTPIAIAVGAAVPPGTYPLVVTATAGALSATAPLALTVSPPAANYTLQLANSITIAQNATALVPVQIVRTGGFVGVQVQIGALTVPVGGNAWVGPTLTTGDTTTLQLVGGTPGTYPVTLVASGGSLIRQATIQVTVTPSNLPNWWLVPQPRELQVPRGQFINASLILNRVQGFTDAISLSAITDAVGQYVVEFLPPVTTDASVAYRIYASPNVTVGPHLVILRGVVNGVERRALLTILVQ